MTSCGRPPKSTEYTSRVVTVTLSVKHALYALFVPLCSCKAGAAHLLSRYDQLWPPTEEEAPKELLQVGWLWKQGEERVGGG